MSRPVQGLQWRPALMLGGLVAWVLGSSLIYGQDFQKGVKPFLDKYCYECHGNDLAKGEINFEEIKDDRQMFSQQRLWREVLNQVTVGEMPPAKKKVRPSLAEIEQLQREVHGLVYRAQLRTKVDPGSVTIRRLNRPEYNNTIRDLCLVEGNFSMDFPADDTGYGFDNIGDVLSFSPVHLERYIAAADLVAGKAMPTGPSEPDGTGFAMVDMLPRGKNVQQQRYFNPTASMSGAMEVPRDGDYLISVRLRATGSAGDPPPKVSFLVDGVEVGVYAFKTAVKSETAEVKTTIKQGKHNFTLTWLNAPEKPATATRTLSGLRLRLLGPLDTRTDLQRRLSAMIEGKTTTARSQFIVNWFVSRAFRRPATVAEMQRYERVFNEAEKVGGSWEAGTRAMIAVVLASPKFIFRAEQDEQPTAQDAHPVGEFALASRLSYFLWGSLPDEELFALAANKKLSGVLEAQAKRMLRDPRSQYLVTGFGLQWLQVRRLATVSPDTTQFPLFNENLRAAMVRETELFLTEIVRDDRNVLDIIDADFTYVNRSLATLYKINVTAFSRGRDQGEFLRIQLPAGERGGVLTQASILTATSNPDRTSPVKRGKWILEQILGSPPPPAPPAVASLESQHKLAGTLRQRMEQHRADPTCASCHTRMDAIGFAFEKFDAIGQSRTVDDGGPIDTSGKLPDGRTFKGATQLKAILKDDQARYVRNLSAKLLTYGLGRGLEFYDEPALDHIAEATNKGGNHISALVLGVVLSDPFRLRRGTSQVESGSETIKKK